MLPKKQPIYLIVITLVLLGAVMIGSYKSFFGAINSSAIDPATYNRLQVLEKQYSAIKRERAALTLVVEDQSRAIEILNNQLTSSKENYKKFDQILKKIQSKYEALNRFDNYSSDSITSYFSNRYGQQ